MNKGEIWLINLNPTIGAEIQKTRPAVIVNNNAVGILPLKVIVPLTDWKPHYQSVPWLVKLIPDYENKLQKISGADAFQIRSVSEQRFVKKVGKICDKTMQELKNALKVVLEIN
jgi:mRNA interferase MazF